MKIKVKIIGLCGETTLDEDNINKFIESEECAQLLNIQTIDDGTSVLITYSPDKPQMFSMPQFTTPEEGAQNE